MSFDDPGSSSVAVVLGTRPEVVKLSGIIRLLGDRCRLVHTGQHFEEKMSRVFLEEFKLPQPEVHLTVGGESRGAQIGEAVRLLDEHFAERRPSAVLVQGDTNATLAGALAANARELPLVHVEAGMRSFDRRMPEEHNRIVADHLADLCCAPTDANAQNLTAEGIPRRRIAVTGNTVIEAVRERLPEGAKRRRLLTELGLEAAGYVLATFHRPENVDDRVRLETILESLGKLSLPVVLPLHPRTRDRVTRFGMSSLLDRIRVVEPLDYQTFLCLSAESGMLVTDSGGLQVEATVYRRPILVVRASTEYPEILGTFSALVEPDGDLVAAAGAWLDRLPTLHRELAEVPSPYGDGDASRRCVEALAGLVLE